MFKKIGIAIGVLFLLGLITAITLPFVINVDKYRPQISELINQKINGKFELGKLSLSLWGQIRIEVEKISLQDAVGHDILKVKDAFIHLPFLPLISGSPVLTFKMNHPEVIVIKDKAGKLDVISLIKSAPDSGAQSPPSAGNSTSPVATSKSVSTPEPTSSVQLPALLTRARVGIEFRDAFVTYRDEATALSSQVKDLNLVLKDISLSHPTELELWADLDTTMGKVFSVKGPIRMDGKAQPALKDGRIESISLNSTLNLDSLDISAAQAFHKTKGIVAQLSLVAVATEKEAKIEKLQAKFFNAELNASGEVIHLDNPVIRFGLKSNVIELKPWVELIPMLKDYELGGSFQFDAEAKGPTQQLGYEAKLLLTGLTAKAGQLKTQPRIDGLVHVKTNEVDQIQLTMKAPGNDLKIQGKVVSFIRPKVDFTVTSSGMDLDQLIAFPPPTSASSSASQSDKTASANPSNASTANSTLSGKQAAANKQDFDALLNPIRENKILNQLVFNLSVQMAMVKAYQVKVADISCKMSLKDLVGGVDACSLKVFSGGIKADAHLNLKPKAPVYDFRTQVASLDIGQAVKSQLELFKNTLTGSADFSLQGQGSSLNAERAIPGLKASGNMKIRNAQFATIDVTKMVSDGINKSVEKLGDKVPGLKGKRIGENIPNRGSTYDLITSDFTIADGKFSAPNFSAQSKANEGVDLKGQTTVGLQDYSLKTTWDVVDTYNLTKVKDFSVEQNGVKVEHVFTEGNSPFHFSVNAGCTVKAPCYSYTEVPEQLAKVALNNISQAVQGKARDEVKKQAEQLIKKAPPGVQNQLNNQFKKFFH